MSSDFDGPDGDEIDEALDHTMWCAERENRQERLPKRRRTDLELRIKNQKAEITRLLALQAPSLKADLEKFKELAQRIANWREEGRYALKFGEPEDMARALQWAANIGYDAEQALAECKTLERAE